MSLSDWSDRRRRRSDIPHVAMRLQLRSVADRLGLDAIVLADDIGTPLACVGDPEISDLLVEAAMWPSQDDAAVDWFTRAWFEALDPTFEDSDVVSMTIPAPQRDTFWKVIAVGMSPETPGGVEQAVRGIERIVREAA